MALGKFNVFSSFEEAKESQQYDHLYQIAVSLSTVSGVDLAIIRQNNLHILVNGKFPLEDYIVENNIKLLNYDLYNSALNYWKKTNAWSIFFRFNNEYLYFKDHSDRNYNVKEFEIENLINLDSNGNDIIFENYE